MRNDEIAKYENNKQKNGRYMQKSLKKGKIWLKGEKKKLLYQLSKREEDNEI